MTAMPENDLGRRDTGILLRDIGRSSSRAAGTVSDDAELMRAAQDPLLVRRVVQGVEQPGNVWEGVAGGPRTAVLPLGARILGTVEDTPGGGELAARRYDAPAGRLEPSLGPVIFAPEPEDRAAALDLNHLAHATGPDKGLAIHLVWMGLCGVGVLALSLILS